jgi:hypothetical protein
MVPKLQQITRRPGVAEVHEGRLTVACSGKEVGVCFIECRERKVRKTVLGGPSSSSDKSQPRSGLNSCEEGDWCSDSVRYAGRASCL